MSDGFFDTNGWKWWCSGGLYSGKMLIMTWQFIFMSFPKYPHPAIEGSLVILRVHIYFLQFHSIPQMLHVIFTFIWPKFVVNVGKYAMHWAYEMITKTSFPQWRPKQPHFFSFLALAGMRHLGTEKKTGRSGFWCIFWAFFFLLEIDPKFSYIYHGNCQM